MIDRSLVTKLMCVGGGAAVMMPAGRALFPYVSGEFNGMQFHALEVVVSAALGFGIYALLD